MFKHTLNTDTLKIIIITKSRSNSTILQSVYKLILPLPCSGSLCFELHILFYGRVLLLYSNGSSMLVLTFGKVSVLFYCLTTSYTYYRWMALFSQCDTPCGCRWPYPFLDLSSSYAPLWYAFNLLLDIIMILCSWCQMRVCVWNYVLSMGFHSSWSIFVWFYNRHISIYTWIWPIKGYSKYMEKLQKEQSYS